MLDQMFLALLSIAVARNMDHLVLLLGTGFLGSLRAHEIRNLTFGDFQTPTRPLSEECTLLSRFVLRK